MGVLGDDDIEKLNTAFKNRKIDKIFFNPKKASNAFYITLVFGIIAFYVAVIFGLAWSDLNVTISESVELGFKQELDFNEFKDIVISNSDCDTLKRIYAGLHNSDLDWKNTEQLIKDEIYYRC